MLDYREIEKDEPVNIDVKAEVVMRGNFYFPNAKRLIHSVKLIDTNTISAYLKHPPEYRATVNRIRSAVRQDGPKSAIHMTERTLIVPLLDLVLKQRLFKRSELLVKNGKLHINRGTAFDSNWYKLAQEIVSLHNNLINELFHVYPSAWWRRIQTPKINEYPIMHTRDDFPWCLNHWHISFRENNKWVKVQTFDTEFVSVEDGLARGLSWAEMDSQLIKRISRVISGTSRADIRWSVGWEYLYFAAWHLDSEEYRSAVIDLDTVTDYVVRRHIINRIQTSKEHAMKLLESVSTGDLLDIAEALSKDENERALWKDLKRIHNLRNTVLHKYQRRFSKSTLESIYKASDSIVALLRELT